MAFSILLRPTYMKHKGKLDVSSLAELFCDFSVHLLSLEKKRTALYFVISAILELYLTIRILSDLINSGAPVARRVAKRSPILITGKKRKPMSGFSHGCHR